MAEETKRQESKNIPVFVYGSLKQGHSNSPFLDGAHYVGVDSLPGPYVMFDLGAFPAVSERPVGTLPNAEVRGELYYVDAEEFAALDILEGHPSFYKRERLKLSSGIVAWVYLVPYEEYREITEVTDGWWFPSESERKQWAS